MYKKAWCTCRVVFLLTKTIAFWRCRCCRRRSFVSSPLLNCDSFRRFSICIPSGNENCRPMHQPTSRPTVGWHIGRYIGCEYVGRVSEDRVLNESWLLHSISWQSMVGRLKKFRSRITDTDLPRSTVVRHGRRYIDRYRLRPLTDSPPTLDQCSYPYVTDSRLRYQPIDR